ncbi:MAG: STT3 domain-containing protein [Desulfovibrio sp.]
MTTALQRILGPAGPPVSQPDPRKDWKLLLLVCLLAWLVNLAMRLIDLSEWGHPGLFVNGGHVMATHDAYYWLAAAKGVRGTFNSEMQNLLKVLAVFFDGDLVRAAFYGPALLSGLVGVVGALWGWLLAGRNGAWLAGLLSGLAPGFFRRTRLGYFDTDLMTLLAPLLMSFFLFYLLRNYLVVSWRRDSGDAAGTDGVSPFFLVLPFALIARMGWWFHQDIFLFGLVLLFLAFGLLLVAGKPEKRGEALLLLAIFAMLAFWGREGTGYSYRFAPWSLLAAPALVAGWMFAPLPLRHKISGTWCGVGFFLAVVLAGGFWGWPLQAVWSQLAPYFKPVAEGVVAGASVGVTPPVYPAIAQSIIEAEGMSILGVLLRLGPFVWLAPFGILGLFWVLLRRPAALLLLPLLGLGIAGWKLGVRFTMFGGPAVAIGLAVPLAWALDRAVRNGKLRNWQQAAVQALVGLAILTGLALHYQALPLTPVMDRPHGEALVALGEKVPEGSMVWTWWDYGYATQFYAGRMTPSDGGQHGGRYIYPTALALTSDSLQQSAGIIKYAANHGGDPSPLWDQMGAEKAQTQVEALRTEDVPEPENPQYLVVPWSAMRLSKWINFFGSWRLDNGPAVGRPLYQRVTTPFQIDPGRGLFVPADGSRPFPISSVDVLDGGDYKHHDFLQNLDGAHLVINKGQQDTYLLDETFYSSTLVRLLVGNPEDPAISEHFQLVVEGTPHVRIYRVK